MITAFTVKNFKAIGEEPVRIELKPITLLFGANSAGKSSILHALYYAYEVFNNNLNVEKILLGENNILDLGGFKRFVHNDNFDDLVYLNRSIILRFDLNFTKDHISDFFSNTENNQKSIYASHILNIISDVKTAYVEVEISWRNNTKRPCVSRYETGINDEKIATIISEVSSGNVVISYLKFSHSIFNNFQKSNSNTMEILAKKCIYPEYDNPLRLELNNQDDNSLPKNWLNFHGIFCKKQTTISVEGSDLKFDFEDLFNILLVAPKNLVSKWLGEMCYLGPLREIPSRYSSDNNLSRYSRYPDCNSKRWATGLAAWDFLYWIGQQKLYQSTEFYKKLTYAIDDAVMGTPSGYQPPTTAYMIEDFDKEYYTNAFRTTNYWLSLKLDTGYEIKIELYREISSEIFDDYSEKNSDELIKKILKQPEKIRIWLLDKLGRKLTPHEVGVGISQVLPVVVAAIGVEAPLVIIEQPELHIHPAMQVQLGDLFIGQSNEKKFFLIETHSENLVLRLMRRIRENVINPKDINVVFVEKLNDGSRFTKLRLDEDGDFIDEWPGGFFEESFHEKFAGR